jgi:hypothetical protein
LTTPTPTLTGSAPAASAGAPIELLLYSGHTTAASALARFETATVGSGGSFSFTVTPGLSDGPYTAAAAESVGGVGTETAPVSLYVKANPPQLKIISPYAGGTLPPRPVFYGTAGNELDDLPGVTVSLHQGPSGSAPQLGTMSAQRNGTAWIAPWPSALQLGLYTLVATQSDSLGHTTTVVHTFIVVPAAAAVIGTDVEISQGGIGSVPILCTGKVNTKCRGTVTVTTAAPLRPGVGGPARRLRLFKVGYSADGATTLVVRGRLSAGVARALRRYRRLQVRVTATMSIDGGASARYSGLRRANIA